MDIDPQKIITNPLFPGLLGACIGLRFAPGINWGERAMNVVSGTLCACFVAPAAGQVFKLTSVEMLMALAFVTGMFGMSLAAAITQGLRDIKVGEIITGWISRKG